MFDKLKTVIKRNTQIKRFIMWSISPTNNPRPRLWVNGSLIPLYTKKGKGQSSAEENHVLTCSRGISFLLVITRLSKILQQ